MFKRTITRIAIPACAALLIGGSLTSCKDDLLTGQPSWLGESIYAELERRGNFTETLKLINAQDEDYASVLNKTGSKTLFVANDEAWARFYRNNPWGITSIESMTPAQKKLIFKANMINSAYLLELLGNIPSTDASKDPEEGGCMRRANSVNLMDSVPLVKNSQFPEVNPARLEDGVQIDFWRRIRDKDTVRILQDGYVASMIHFMPKFMQVNNIKSEDVEFMTNGEIKTNTGAFVNGKPVTEGDITCQNGYIHVLEDVALPLDNMANVIAQNPEFSIYSRLLNRFSYPHFDENVNKEYHRQYGGEDSVYVKRYFNLFDDKADSWHNQLWKTDANDGNDDVSKSTLPYDPGWNLYCMQSARSASDYQRDAAVMLVPTDEAMKDYLQHDGSDINDRYANAGPGETAWDNAPDNVVLPLLRNTMLYSLTAAIPSQFSSINNTASEPMGVTKADIDSVLWACNGVIYKTKKVYVAPDYVSVYYPCVVRGNEDMKIVYQSIEKDNSTQGGEGFKGYLNNMGETRYSFVIPTDNALQTYYDPVSRYRKASANANAKSTAVAYKFYLDASNQLSATPYLVDWSEEALDEYGRGLIDDSPANNVTLSTTFNKKGDVFNHFCDIINGSLAVTQFRDGQKFYLSRSGSPIIVEWNAGKVTGVAGSFQYEHGYYVPVTDFFDKSDEGNGVSYVVDNEPLMTTTTSPYSVITDSLRKDNFGTFAELMKDAGITREKDIANHVTMDQALTPLDNYHYTIYVPTNESIQALIDAHLLPTAEDINDVKSCIERMDAGLEPEDYNYMNKQAELMQEAITNFVNYHIQDNSVFVEGENHSNDVYESSCMDPESSRFVKLYVSYSLGGDLKVTDNCGNTRTVDRNLCNILARQYYFSKNDGTAGKSGEWMAMKDASQIYSSAFAVIHQIDAPLFSFKDENHPNGCYYSPVEYAKVQQIIADHPADDETPTPNTTKRRTR